MALAWENLSVAADDLPTEEQLARDLQRLARNGVWKSLPRQYNGDHIPHLWRIALELADDESEDLPALVAKVVVPAVKRVEPQKEQEAIAEIFWINLQAPDGRRTEDALPLTGHANRYSLAADKLGKTEADLENNLRQRLLKKVARLIIGRLKEHRAAAAEFVEPDIKPGLPETEAAAMVDIDPLVPRQSSKVLVGGVGLLLTMLGAGWLLAVLHVLG